jgi:hypothetical protein
LHQQTTTRSIARQPRIRYGIINEAQSALITTYAHYKVFHVLSMYVNARGECFPSIDTLVRETKLTRPCVYRTLAYLSQVGLVTRTDNRLFQLHESPYDPDCNSTVTTLGSLGDTKVIAESYPSLITSQVNYPIEEGDEMSNPKITNITSRQPSGSKPVRESEFAAYGKQHRGAVDRPASSVSQRLLEHVRKLSGVAIADAYKFDTVSYGEALLHQYIDEAWRIRDALKSDQFVTFNAAKVLYYAANRDRLRLSSGADRKDQYDLIERPAAIERHTKRIVAMPRDAQRKIELERFIDVYRVSRRELSGRFESVELDDVSSCFANL